MSVLDLATLPDDERTPNLEAEHPVYRERAGQWQILLDALDGAGGFVTGDYLWKFPSEIPDDYTERRGQARYHNFVGALVDLYVRYLFAEGVNRETANPELEAWWQDVDGAGTTLESFMRRAVSMALASSHSGILVDRTPDAPSGPSRAEERAVVYATLYPPTAILDWRVRRGILTGVKLKEAVTTEDITEQPEGEPWRYLLWDREAWIRFDAEGALIPEDTPIHNLGLVPFVTLVPEPSALDPFVGRSIVGNANIVKALFNRSSEEDHVLRNQAFSLLWATMPAEATAEDIQTAQATIAANFGVKRVVVAKGDGKYVSPDMSAPAQVAANIQFLIRELFRAAHVPYAQDSREAESAEAIALKHRELNQMLQGTAAACVAAERAMSRFWFAWTRATAEQAEADFEAAEVSITYPRQFFTESLLDDLAAWARAVTAVHSDTFRKRIEKRIVQRVDPDLVQDDVVLTKVHQEIDASQPSMSAEAAGLRQRAEARMAGLVPPGPVPPEATGEAA